MGNAVQSGTSETEHDFLSLEAGAGDALQLQDASPLKLRYHAKLLGYLNKHSLIVTHPCLDEKLMPVATGSDLLVRGFSGVKTYEFNTTVLNVCSSPYPYLHLSFPERVNVLVMRGAMRIKARFPCSVVATVGGLKMPAIFNDLSVTGANIQAAVRLGKCGDSVQLHFSLPVESEEQTFVMAAIIRNVSGSQEDHAAMYGVEFVATTQRARVALQSYVHTTLIEMQHDQP